MSGLYGLTPVPPSLICRSVRAKKEKEPKKKLHMSTEMLDLDEALSFLEGVASGPEKMTTESVTALGSFKSSPAHTPEPHQRVSSAFLFSNSYISIRFPFHQGFLSSLLSVCDVYFLLVTWVCASLTDSLSPTHSSQRRIFLDPLRQWDHYSIYLTGRMTK